MTKDEFLEIVRVARLRQDNLLEVKGADYTRSNADRLSNFKEVSKMLGISPLQVWGVYWLKHVFALSSFISSGKLESEGLTGRMDDAVNYLYLLEGLVDESE